MEKSYVTKTRELNLCTSCEICSAVCPKDAITIENELGQFLPKIDDKKCNKCSLCLQLCPGIDIDPLKLRYEKLSDNILDSKCLESYTAYSKNQEIRKNSASGRLITNLIAELIKNKDFDSAFVLDFDKFDGNPARLKATCKIEEILKAAKSKYIPASVYNVIKTLEKGDNGRYIIVCTPCQIHGIKKFIRKFNISEENYLFLGLFCDKTLNFNIIRYFENIYKKSNEKLIKFEFRTKENYGWPGNSKIYFDSGRNIIIDRGVRMQLKRFFQLNRCLFCFDKLNKLADISFGDCYITGEADFDGKSSVIVRTKKGKQIFDKYSYLFNLKKVDVDEIRKSQHFIDKGDNFEFAKLLIEKNNIYPDISSNYEINDHASRNLSKLQRYIKWGQNYNINKIRYYLFLSKIGNIKYSIIKTIQYALYSGIISIESLFIYFYPKYKISSKNTQKNIIIIGGELFNKGAQAMTFTVVDEMKKRFPDKNIYLFSTQDFDREYIEKGRYTFKILPWDGITRRRLLSFLNKFINKKSKYGYLENDIEKTIKNGTFIIDISGYALSSQFNWFRSLDYLLNIILSKKYCVPYYIFPQSIGPFNYPLKFKILLYPLMNMYLKYPKKIFPREKEGEMWVRKFSEKNVERSYDIVLQTKQYDLSNIYNQEFYRKEIESNPESVGIIPNMRVIEKINPAEIYSIYDSLIDRLIKAKKTVYVLRHSYEDLEICEKIKNNFLHNDSVILISEDLNAFELESIIKQFDFVIASRYHSIIHAYKNGVPTLVIGWATKYFELLEDFDQMDYCFDVRYGINLNEIENKLDKMIFEYKYERDKIINKINAVTKENIFDKI
ncbi:MAG: Coenzyme F420 hydrogenase/dehydrogenase, beta subunit C-terminal domain [Candidatus Methanoperedens sp.]|nr:Coenzyme F420 hydrogenase/dehydrogenase, beta subunit C-terminal domain [Candidatus Methanoperedens sp.]